MSRRDDPHRLTSLLPSNIKGGLQPPTNTRREDRSSRQSRQVDLYDGFRHSDPPSFSSAAAVASSDSADRKRQRQEDDTSNERPKYNKHDDIKSQTGSRGHIERDSGDYYGPRQRPPQRDSDDRWQQSNTNDDVSRYYQRSTASRMNYPDLPPPPSSSAKLQEPSAVSSHPTATSLHDGEEHYMLPIPTSTGAPNENTKFEESVTKTDRDPNTTELQQGNDESFERDFYLQEDEGHYVQDDNSEQQAMGRFLFTSDKIQARVTQKVSARQNALMDDQVAWEENRLVSAGTVRRGVLENHLIEQETRVTLLVHQVKPPFLDGRVAFSTIREAVPTVRDASSDFAKAAREGSATLRMLRAKRDKHAMRTKFWELGGTRMGNAMKVKENKEKTADDLAATTDNGEIDYKKSSGFATHMNKKSTAVSNFARTKTIRQQREFLPVYAARDALLNVIRENNVVVIVGETGTL
jgi:hypothetical protein